MHFHCVSAHFGGTKPWEHNLHSSQILSSCYYDDNNMPSRHNSMHPRLKGKLPKMLEWRSVNADWYIWMDSSVKINTGIDIPEIIIKTARNNPLCLFRHTQATSIQEEAACVLQGISRGNDYFVKRYSGEPIANQLETYLNDDSFKDNNLFQMTFFAYHKSAAALMQEWFVHNCIWSIEDQISFPYVLSKSGLQYSCFEGNVLSNEIFTWDWQSREDKLQERPIQSQQFN